MKRKSSLKINNVKSNLGKSEDESRFKFTWHNEDTDLNGNSISHDNLKETEIITKKPGLSMYWATLYSLKVTGHTIWQPVYEKMFSAIYKFK